MVTEIATDQTPAIEFRNVSLSFDEKLVLSDVSFQLDRGEMIFITGESGSGKSVLLRLAIALDQPDSGQVLIEGRDVGVLDEDRQRTRRGLRAVMPAAITDSFAFLLFFDSLITFVMLMSAPFGHP